MTPKNLILAAAALALSAAACESNRDIGWERERTVIGPVPLKDRIAYVDSARDRVIAVDVSGSAPRVDGYPLGRRAIFAMPTPDRTHLAVITRGEEAVIQGQIDEEPQLWVIDMSRPDSTPISYPIGS